IPGGTHQLLCRSIPLPAAPRGRRFPDRGQAGGVGHDGPAFRRRCGDHPVSGALSGRTAIVTGAASGIGLGIAARLLAAGAAVFAAPRGKEDLDRVYERAAIAGGFVGELHQPGVADDLAAAAVEALGHVDVLVNNAGGGVIAPTLDHTEETL